MRKYLDMENSTIELNISDYSVLINVLHENFSEIIEKNFKRLIINVKESEIPNILNDIPQKMINNEILILLNTFMKKKNIDFALPNNIIITNNNHNNILTNKDIYNKIPFSKDKKTLIIESINAGTNIIIEPEIKHQNITSYMKDLYTLFDNIKDKDINIGGFLVSSYLMREHPCNGYLCNGWKCKKRISMLPKYIYVDDKLDVYPHDLKYDRYLIGNISNNSISDVLDKYFLSENYSNFISDCKSTYINYLPKYPFDLFPLIEFIKKDVAENE
ncbi:MAG: hypothetical protein J6J17_05495 [Bacilli bacterium]|nr:hypothetical protein [Bacilli bacterium]